jgi:hypothetical protein
VLAHGNVFASAWNMELCGSAPVTCRGVRAGIRRPLSAPSQASNRRSIKPYNSCIY